MKDNRLRGRSLINLYRFRTERIGQRHTAHCLMMMESNKAWSVNEINNNKIQFNSRSPTWSLSLIVSIYPRHLCLTFVFCRQEAVPNNHVQIDIWGECAEKSSNIITRQDKSSKWLVSEPSSAIQRNLFRVLGISTGLHSWLVIFTIYIHIKLWDPQLDQWPSLSYSHSTPSNNPMR